MRKIVTAAAALAWLLASPASAEDSLVVADSLGTILGPVIGRSGPSNHNWVDFLQRDGDEFLVLSANAAGVFGTSGRLLFQDGSCSSTPFWSGDPISIGENLTPALTVSGFDVYAIDEGATVIIEPHSYLDVGSSALPTTCHPWGLVSLPVRLVAHQRTLEFTPPLHLELNPLLFDDGFASGDTQRWTLTVP